jgi:hypothetical protein
MVLTHSQPAFKCWDLAQGCDFALSEEKSYSATFGTENKTLYIIFIRI